MVNSMDFINMNGNELLSAWFIVTMIMILWTCITSETEAPRAFIIGFIVFLVFTASIFTIRFVGLETFDPRDKEYYDSQQIETIDYKDGTIIQYAYSNSGERVNINELYEITFHRDMLYREIKINHSWLIFNFENLIKEKMEDKVFLFSEDKEFDK